MPAGGPPPDLPDVGNWLAVAPPGDAEGTLAALLPPLFPAYARVLHPAVRYAGDDDVAVSWAEVAAYNRRTAHRLMQWPAVTGGWEYLADEDQPDVWHDAPPEGHLPVELAHRLVDVLSRHTTTPGECWFGLDEGHPFLGTARGAAPRLGLPRRRYLVLPGPVQRATANLAPEPHEQSANLWWPRDRAWCVVTDVDLASSYLGGSARLVAELLAAPGIEAWPAEPGDAVGFDADGVNPLPERTR